MKTLKSALALILLAAILVSSFCFPACAASAQSITYLEDGSYYIKNFDYPEKPLKYKHIRRISD